MTDDATPKVESLGLFVDGSALAVSNDGHEDRLGKRHGRRQLLHHLR